jgi:hypothetical protein
MSKARILFYDIETSPLKAWIWGCGEQYIRHNQLDKDYNRWGIICITYCWNDGKPAKVIGWDYEKQDTGSVVAEFDEIIKQADRTIGKNSDRFDTKMINAARMFAGLPGYPEWTTRTDDLEKQMRRYFRVPSQALDYYSNQLGLGGKIKMEMQDWIDIVEKNENGLKSYNKMLKYGKKDVEDTRKLWYMLEEHFTPKFDERVPGCGECGSFDRRKSGFSYTCAGKKQRYTCNKCGTRNV